MSLPSSVDPRALSYCPDAPEDVASLSASQTEAPLSDAQTLVQSMDWSVSPSGGGGGGENLILKDYLLMMLHICRAFTLIYNSQIFLDGWFITKGTILPKMKIQSLSTQLHADGKSAGVS